ncbi:MAG: hypothetical protein AAFS10_05800 [Myxococcota bacterium]
MRTIIGKLGLVLVLGWVAGCNFPEPAQRIEVDPRLVEVSESSDVGTGDDEGVADVEEDTASGEDPSFTCDPTCAPEQFCGPDGSCYTLADACNAPLEICDPQVVQRTPEFVCEPVYGSEAGLCRRVCTTETADMVCASGEACIRLLEDDVLSVCRLPCADQDMCHPLGGCSGGFALTSYCRGGCVPFIDRQCPPGSACVPESPELGYCSAFGDVPELGMCDGEARCDRGLSCIDFGSGQLSCYEICVVQAADGAPGSCAEGRLCRQLTPEGVGICSDLCDMFEAAQSCVQGQGCTLLDGTRMGYCALRGDTPEGSMCSGTVVCAENLQCIREESNESFCRSLCLVDAEGDAPGSCASESRCEPLMASDGLGYCVPQ